MYYAIVFRRIAKNTEARNVVNQGIAIIQGAYMNKSNEEYRKLNIEISYWFVALIVAAQIVMFYVLKMAEFDVKFFDYFLKHIIVVGAVGLASLYGVKQVNQKRKLGDNIKNIALLLNSFLITTVVAVIESNYPSTVCVILIPIFLATGFGSNMCLNVATGLAYLSLLILNIASPLMKYAENTNINISISYIEFAILIIITRVVVSVVKDFCFNSAVKIESHESDNQNLETELLKDAMTGLYNHASFYAFLEQITRQNNDDIKSVSLAVVDIDNFKKVNDTYGHSKGDEVILFLAKVLSERFSDVGYVCRYGGEEFAVIFINRKGKEAKQLMDGALEEFRSHVFAWKEDPITFSCGICEYKGGQMTDKELFGIADKVLYRAKNSGKNQCLL